MDQVLKSFYYQIINFSILVKIKLYAKHELRNFYFNKKVLLSFLSFYGFYIQTAR